MRATGSDTASGEPLFRPAAVEAARYSLFGQPCLARPPGTSVTAAAAVLVLAILGSALWLVEIPMRIPAVGMLMPPGGLLKVVAADDGLVKAIHVRDGEQVDRGDLLLEVTPQPIDSYGRTVSSKALDSLQIELGILEDAARRRRDAFQARRRAIEKEQQAADSRLQSIAKQQAVVAEEITVLKARLDRFRSLVDTGHLPRDVLESEQLALLRARSTAAMIESQRNAVRSEIAQLLGRTQELDRELDLADTEHALRQQALRRRIEQQTRQALQPIRAPAPGTVARINVRAGLPVRTNQAVVTIVPGNPTPEAWLYVAAGLARNIRTGESVELHIDAWPAAEHGTRTATITHVSSVPLGSSELPVPMQIAGPVFEIRADIAPTEADVPPLKIGAAIRAQIIGRTFRLYEWLNRRLRPGGRSDRARQA